MLKSLQRGKSSDGIDNEGHRVSRRKGKHASSTENRRMVWENVVWPLILDINRSYFSLKEYHEKRDQFCRVSGVPPSKVAGGFVSLLIKGILGRNKNVYSIHYRLIPYMRKKAPLEYGLVIREVNTKR
ncbi:MAG TPA: hypothetical protein VGQ03_01695 [Nitrososphaera sp.]|nr:hypothetical protein [Nitrososphaera sp.]